MVYFYTFRGQTSVNVWPEVPNPYFYCHFRSYVLQKPVAEKNLEFSIFLLVYFLTGV